jgi:hypothetical protein
MEEYQLGKDATGNPLTEDLFYIHTRTGEIIQLFSAAAGFRVEYGPDGKHANIFDLSKGPNYKPMTQEDFQKAIETSAKRKEWLESGLTSILKQTTEQITIAAMDGEPEFGYPC